jgi:hypothetical protein
VPAGDGQPGPLDTFYITDTIPTTAAKLAGTPPFRILSITGVIEDLLGV